MRRRGGLPNIAVYSFPQFNEFEAHIFFWGGGGLKRGADVAVKN